MIYYVKNLIVEGEINDEMVLIHDSKGKVSLEIRLGQVKQGDNGWQYCQTLESRQFAVDALAAEKRLKTLQELKVDATGKVKGASGYVSTAIDFCIPEGVVFSKTYTESGQAKFHFGQEISQVPSGGEILKSRTFHCGKGRQPLYAQAWQVVNGQWKNEGAKPSDFAKGSATTSTVASLKSEVADLKGLLSQVLSAVSQGKTKKKVEAEGEGK